ncbi:hypothetical protein BGW38_003934 [Lunasporangiospora selenospora]|uniref:Uncharacterized protein n=1 Tax=Lunasporangiospora selenospora TaxID=979761 RepID=A0A9P6G1H3_9FUNG|nr:hypothetical protein BGW38_003934 [Lunasporangiospora selenospora]
MHTYDSLQPNINPSRRTPSLPQQPKKPVPNWHLLVRPAMSDANPRKSNLEKLLDEDLAELRIAMDLFLNSRMNQAEELVMSRARQKPDSMYYQLGVALLMALRAILTFHPDKIEQAMKAFDATLKIANQHRKPASSVVGLSTVKSIGSWVIGNIGAGSFRGMTRLEKHAELVYAEATVLRAGFSVLYYQDFWSLFEESFSLRSAFAVFNGLKSHFDQVEQELKAGGDITEHYLDEHLVTGLIFAASLFNIAISFFPDTIIKLLQFVGFPADRDWGLGLLNTAGMWSHEAPEKSHTDGSVKGMTTSENGTNSNDNGNEGSATELKERLSSYTNEGLRRQICDMAPIAIHLIAASFVPFRHVDYSFAEKINNYNLHKYPESMFFQFLKARHAQVNTRLDDAIAIHEAIEVEQEWRNLKHACTFEQLMCAMMESNHDLACSKSRILLRESNWSKTIFRYLAAITTMCRGQSKEEKRVPELMKKVEPGMQKFCGVEVFPETYCARKANRYLKEGHLILADYDFLVLWNGFEMMPLKSLRVALSNIMQEVQRLEALLPPSMASISERPLPKGDYTIEAASKLWGSFLSSTVGVHALTKADRVEGYDHYYDDLCIAHYLLGLVAKHIAFFPEEVFDEDMGTMALRSFKTVFRYAPYIKDDTYAYYLSHFHVGQILMDQGLLNEAEEKFKYLLSTIHPTLMSLPALIAGKNRNSLEVIVLAKAHAAMYLLNEDRANAGGDAESSHGEGVRSHSAYPSSAHLPASKTSSSVQVDKTNQPSPVPASSYLATMFRGMGFNASRGNVDAVSSVGEDESESALDSLSLNSASSVSSNKSIPPSVNLVGQGSPTKSQHNFTSFPTVEVRHEREQEV